MVAKLESSGPICIAKLGFNERENGEPTLNVVS